MNEIRSLDPQVTPIDPTTAAMPAQDQHSLDQVAVAQVMGLETESDRTQYQQEMDTLIAWAKEEGAEDYIQLKWALRALMSKLGSPPLSEKWITRAARYAHLQLETKRLQTEQESMMR